MMQVRGVAQVGGVTYIDLDELGVWHRLDVSRTVTQVGVWHRLDVSSAVTQVG